MSQFDPTLFADVADAIGLPSPAFVEKDYYAVQLLKTISELELPEGKLIFAGGTCLTKAHLQTYRMSEDLDLKFVPDGDFLNLSDSQKRKYRSDLGSTLINAIENTKTFKLVHKESMSEGRYRCLSVSYPKQYNHISLRPELKLELTEIILQHSSPIEASIGSIYSIVNKQPHEIPTLTCDPIEIILVEKFIGLLRRTAEVNRGYSENDDEALVRHVYDLYLIKSQPREFNNIDYIFKKILEQDVSQFGIRHIQFTNDPRAELLYGLKLLINDVKYKNRYESFLGPLVYNATPPSWEMGIESLQNLANILMRN